MTKKCSKCQTEKDIACFSKGGRAKDGLSNVCRDCHSIYMRAHHQAHSEERKAYGRIYNQTHRTEIRAYKEANKEKIQAYLKEYKARNKKYLAQMERLRGQKIRARAARDAAKTDPQQLKTKAEINTQLRLLDA